jgi:hypothetical protein
LAKKYIYGPGMDNPVAMINAPDENNPFEPFVFECFVDPFGDGNGTDL